MDKDIFVISGLHIGEGGYLDNFLSLPKVSKKSGPSKMENKL